MKKIISFWLSVIAAGFMIDGFMIENLKIQKRIGKRKIEFNMDDVITVPSRNTDDVISQLPIFNDVVPEIPDEFKKLFAEIAQQLSADFDFSENFEETIDWIGRAGTIGYL